MAHILVIDSETQVREVVVKVLERLGHYEVTEAANGAEGLVIYTEQRESIDLVVVNTMVLKSDGTTGNDGMDIIMDLCRQFPDVKIVAITEGGMCGDVSYVDMALGVGAQKAVTKPFVLDDFLEAIEELLSEEEVEAP